MVSMKITIKSFLPSCLKAKAKQPSAPRLQSPSYCSFRKLSDLSNVSSVSIVSDLSSSLLGANLHVFSLKELTVITHNFSRSNFLGEGGFGPVYKGFIGDKFRPGLKAQPVAVKVLDLDGSQGHKEWLAEVIFLGQLRHSHLVNLIGYCCEDQHRLLVYEYMTRGNLENQLFKSYFAALPWLTRIKIAVGAAKGLAFLHENEKPVIFRDLKASNILLDSDFNAKLSDFGLATDGPDGDDSHVTTRVMGTEGYAAPEYVMTGHLTAMSDVYSFGVVLLELLTGRKSLDKNRPSREQNLVAWARPLLKDPHKLDRIMDPRLEGQYSTKGAKTVAALAYQCLSHHQKSRPCMRTVVQTLEPVLELNDIPAGSFVYVVPNEGKQENGVMKKGTEDETQSEKQENGVMKKGTEDENQNEAKREEAKTEVRRGRERCHRHRRARRFRHGIWSTKSRAIHSDTTLYKTLGTNLYSSKLALEREE